ncbi:accessory factor UbiK family protein [Sphingomicrobium lutaoense]|uniref:BMFP domain-containing protein YqiC n=1 Tax=Sphingomicrobium lutaoense TaxID=515949 RepID=A0A839YWL6_9SPHN|nr:accessory factor UbiK family protein [Sphingomicrobium lutaoense]MBB3763426.1 BMFP domain-containing protein YqiC [Sphingomicrobium lutaoense]
MQSQNRFFDDVVRMVNGAAGTFAGMGREAEQTMKDKVREWVGGMDFVSRDEFEAVKAMAIVAREENVALKARLDAMQADTPKAKSAAKKPAAKKKS